MNYNIENYFMRHPVIVSEKGKSKAYSDDFLHQVIKPWRVTAKSILINRPLTRWHY